MDKENQLLMGETGNPPATKLYRCDRQDAPSTILHEELKAAFVGASICQMGAFICEEHDIEEKDVPRTPGRIVLINQMTKNGSGCIEVRWGDAFTPGSILAEYHFSAGKV